MTNFELPRYRCQNCLALWRQDYWKQDVDIKSQSCRYCKIKYVDEDSTPGVAISAYLAKSGYEINLIDPLNHARSLAKIARNIALIENPPDDDWWRYPYMKALLQAFTVAQSFVHFTTFGRLPDFMIGALKLLAQRISVNGIVSVSSGSNFGTMLQSINDYRSEASKLNVRVIASEVGDLPHQKLVIVDGMFAFKGSANLTQYAWRKAEDDKEQIEVVTKINDVIELNNRFFSRAWKSAGQQGRTVTDAQGTRYEHVVEMYMGPYPWDDFSTKL